MLEEEERKREGGEGRTRFSCRRSDKKNAAGRVCSAESLGVSSGKETALTSELDTLGCRQSARKRKEKLKPEAAAPGKSQRGI
jgi:hypothetical protein